MIIVKFDSDQAKNTGVLVKTKSVILQTNWVIEEHPIEIWKKFLIEIIEDIAMKICAKLHNSLIIPVYLSLFNGEISLRICFES